MRRSRKTVYYNARQFDRRQEKEDIFYDARQLGSTTIIEDLDLMDEEINGVQLVSNIVAFPSELKARATTKDLGYDTDSFLIAVDNCCSKCITNSMSDYVGEPKRIDKQVRGIGGDVQVTYVGTVRWSIEDDDGMVHSFTIPETYYNRGSPYRLLSPQHRSQVANDNFPKPRGTWCGTYEDAIELQWAQRRFKRTIKLDQRSNVGIFRSAAGYSKLHIFCHELRALNENPLEEGDFYCLSTRQGSHEVSDDEMSEHPSEVNQDEDRLDLGVPTDEQDIPLARRHPELPDDAFTDLGPADGGGGENWVDIVPEDEEVQGLTAQAQLLAWHYRLGHVSFAKIRKMAARGDLPANLAKCKTPKCAACVYGKFHKRSWRSKAPVNENKIPPATRPGAVIAIDQMISETPGLIAQMSGFITKQRYKVTTVFVDHFSGLSFTHLQKTTNALETVEGKRAFERYARTHGVSVSHYHADNGIFASAQFVKAVEFDGQTISYCAVNAHHQNGKAEKKIRDLQDMARSMLLHAKQRWPSAITSNLWP
jgi:hypothetical protein